MLPTTWSGQPAETAWHWNPETYQKLGNIVYLLSTGKAEARTTAYNEYINLKRWFIVEEFEAYIDKLEIEQKKRDAKPLREIMEEIYNERSPQTHWNALEGPRYTFCLPPLDTIVPLELQKPNGILPAPKEYPTTIALSKQVQPIKKKAPAESVQIELMLF
jgi:hypothetical protein